MSLAVSLAPLQKHPSRASALARDPGLGNGSEVFETCSIAFGSRTRPEHDNVASLGRELPFRDLCTGVEVLLGVPRSLLRAPHVARLPWLTPNR